MLHVRISRRGKDSYPVCRDAVRITTSGIGDTTEAIDGLEDIFAVWLGIEVNQNGITIEDGNVVDAVFRRGNGKGGTENTQA